MPLRTRTSPLLRVSFAVVLTVMCGSLAKGCKPHSDSPSPRPLEPGRQVEARLRKDEAHTYLIRLRAGDYLHLTVDQRGADVVATLFDPAGEEVRSVNIARPVPSQGLEPIHAVAASDGVHRLDVRARATRGNGGYVVRIAEQRPAGERERQRAAAWGAFTEGERLRFLGTGEALRNAQSQFVSALELWRMLGDEPSQEALTLRRLGSRRFDSGDYAEAASLYEQALEISRGLRDTEMEGFLLNDLGRIHRRSNRQEKAAECFQQALEIARTQKHYSLELYSLLNFGYLYESQSENQKALEYYQQAREGWRELGNPGEEASALFQLGSLYAKLSQLPDAFDALRGARHLWREMGDLRSEAVALTKIGWIFHSADNPGLALLSYDQAIPLRQAADDMRGLAVTLDHRGTALLALGRDDEALGSYTWALRVFEDLDEPLSQAHILDNIGWAYEIRGDTESAIRFHRLALKGFREADDKNAEAGALLGIARMERNRGNLASALSHATQSVEIVDSLRAGVESHALRTSFLASRYDQYETYIDLLMEHHRLSPGRGYDIQAFEASERSHARSLFETLDGVGGAWRAGLGSDLLQKEETLRRQIHAKTKEKSRLLEAGRPHSELETVDADLRLLLLEREALRGKLRAGAKSLHPAQPLRLAEIQRDVLDENTLLLEFSLGEPRSYLWVVGSRSLDSYVLPGKKEIEEKAREVHRMFSSRDMADTEKARRAATALADSILGPARSKLGNKRLEIVADRALHYVPFEALSLAGAPGSPRTLLLEEHEIGYLPSASVLAMLRRELAGRRPAPRRLALVADPVFDRDDERFKGLFRMTLARSAPPEDAALERALEGMGLTRFVRLKGAGREADAILSLAGPGEGILAAVGFDATRDLVLGGELGLYQILHFATHGFSDTESSDLSGLVLSLVDTQGKQRDGLVRAHEIDDLSLSADLVVLSACRSAGAQDLRGEGLMGLTRSFLQAGVPSLVVSRWNVSDRGAEKLMQGFYERLLKRGMRPAQALREAQLAMSRDPEWRAPYFWAVFSLQAEWK